MYARKRPPGDCPLGPAARNTVDAGQRKHQTNFIDIGVLESCKTLESKVVWFSIRGVENAGAAAPGIISCSGIALQRIK